MLKPQDLNDIQTLGRKIAQTNGDFPYKMLDTAAQMIILTDDPEEKQTLMSYFDEGARNYAMSELHKRYIITAITLRVRYLTLFPAAAEKEYILG